MGICANPDCNVGETGNCSEGHDPLASCPFYGKEIENDQEYDDLEDEGASEDVIEEDVNNSQKGGFIGLPSGEALNEHQANDFVWRRPIRLIAIVGEQDSGKSTLINCIYFKFMQGTFADYSFAGSDTLVGFERRMHLWRIKSGIKRPDTKRTSLADGIQFLHFSLGNVKGDDRRIDVFLTDRSGEKYRRVMDGIDNIGEIFEIAKADKLVFLLDGAKVSTPAKRANATASVRQMLKLFIDEGVIDKRTCVQVVTTKIDCIEKLEGDDKVHVYEFLSNFERQLQDRFEQQVAELRFFKVSARDPDNHFEPAYHVDDLFASWLDSRSAVFPVPGIEDLPLRRQFDLLLARTPMENIP